MTHVAELRQNAHIESNGMSYWYNFPSSAPLRQLNDGVATQHDFIRIVCDSLSLFVFVFRHVNVCVLTF